MFVHLAVIIVALLFLSCKTVSVGMSHSKSWFMDESKKINGTVRLLGVSVDKGGSWDSIEREIQGLAPLYFWEQGYLMTAGTERADYAADIRVREREYVLKWQTKRSLSAEVRIWPCGNDFSPGDFEQMLPLAVGKVSSANGSFSSSDTSARMLSLAIKQAVKRLGSGNRGE
jgi:hypothetical protein